MCSDFIKKMPMGKEVGQGVRWGAGAAGKARESCQTSNKSGPLKETEGR